MIQPNPHHMLFMSSQRSFMNQKKKKTFFCDESRCMPLYVSNMLKYIYFRQTQDNVFLLREEVNGLKKKLERAELRCVEYSQLLIESKVCLDKASFIKYSIYACISQDIYPWTWYHTDNSSYTPVIHSWKKLCRKKVDFSVASDNALIDEYFIAPLIY